MVFILTKLAYETSYLDYSIPSFKVPGFWSSSAPGSVFLALKLPEWFFCWSWDLGKMFFGMFYVNLKVSWWLELFLAIKFWKRSGWKRSKTGQNWHIYESFQPLLCYLLCPAALWELIDDAMNLPRGRGSRTRIWDDITSYVNSTATLVHRSTKTKQ